MLPLTPSCGSGLVSSGGGIQRLCFPMASGNDKDAASPIGRASSVPAVRRCAFTREPVLPEHV